MAVFVYPVPYTATLTFNAKPRKYNVLGSLTVNLEELSLNDLTRVASWKATKYQDATPLGGAGECYWHNGRFMSPILIARDDDTELDFRPLRPADVRRVMMTTDRVVTFDDVIFRSSQPNGYEHDVFKETFAEDGWRPENLPNGAYVEDNFALKSCSARDLLASFILVDGNLFQVTSEPVLGLIYSSERQSVTIHIRTADKFHEDWEVFGLDRLDDALAYASDRWPDAAIRINGSAPVLHDESHLSFNDEAYSLISSARSLLDEVLITLPNLCKDVGMAIVRMNRIVPEFGEGRPDLPDADTLEEIALGLPGIRSALKPHDQPRLDATIERWNLRPSVSTFTMR
jgi:hypothetical protein